MSTAAAAPSRMLLGDPNDHRSHAEQFPEWHLATCIDINEIYNDPHGLLSYSTIVLEDAGLAHVPPPIPLPLPEPGGNQAENGYALSVNINSNKLWDAWILAAGKAKSTYLRGIHPSMHPLIIQQMGGAQQFLNEPVRMLGAATRILCTPKISDIARVNQELREPLIILDKQSFAKFVARTYEKHHFLAANGSAHTQESQIGLFSMNIQACTHAHIFSQTLNAFDHAHPVVGAPERTLLALTRELTIDAEKLETAPRAYAAKAIPSPSSTKPTGPKPKTRQQQWCWSHGKCFHTSTKCTKRAPGHMEAATISNQMGSTIPFADPRWQS